MSEVKVQSGYWFWPLDANTIDFMPQFAKTVAEIDSVEDEILNYESCETLYCAQPFIWPTTSRIKYEIFRISFHTHTEYLQ